MIFTPIIALWGPGPDDDAVKALASDLGLATKNVRRWVDLDTIPVDWFGAVVRAAKARGLDEVTEARLIAIAEGRRLKKEAAATRDAHAQDAA